MCPWVWKHFCSLLECNKQKQPNSSHSSSLKTDSIRLLLRTKSTWSRSLHVRDRQRRVCVCVFLSGKAAIQYRHLSPDPMTLTSLNPRGSRVQKRHVVFFTVCSNHPPVFIETKTKKKESKTISSKVVFLKGEHNVWADLEQHGRCVSYMGTEYGSGSYYCSARRVREIRWSDLSWSINKHQLLSPRRIMAVALAWVHNELHYKLLLKKIRTLQIRTLQ